MSWRRTKQPVRGWNSRMQMQNPRPPAAPASLDLSLEEYFAAAGAMGLLSAQLEEPDAEWALNWSLDFGERMAREAERRRKTKRRRSGS